MFCFICCRLSDATVHPLSLASSMEANKYFPQSFYLYKATFHLHFLIRLCSRRHPSKFLLWCLPPPFLFTSKFLDEIFCGCLVNPRVLLLTTLFREWIGFFVCCAGSWFLMICSISLEMEKTFPVLPQRGYWITMLICLLVSVMYVYIYIGT